ncbi:MAG: D-amino peptidase, partial [Myxococcota bacterium]
MLSPCDLFISAQPKTDQSLSVIVVRGADMKVFISADIEGCCGVTHWDEASRAHPDYPRFLAQLQREVNAACEGAIAAGATTIRVRDAHASARNLDPWSLPEPAELVREWSGHPHMMIQDIDDSFDALVMIGYHSPGGSGGSPLSHTLSGDYADIRVNGQRMAELHLYARMAAVIGVPTVAVTGDEALCALAREEDPRIRTVSTGAGRGRSVLARHPAAVIRDIREAVCAALQPPLRRPRPQDGPFHLAVTYRDHRVAYRAS